MLGYLKLVGVVVLSNVRTRENLFFDNERGTAACFQVCFCRFTTGNRNFLFEIAVFLFEIGKSKFDGGRSNKKSAETSLFFRKTNKQMGKTSLIFWNSNKKTAAHVGFWQNTLRFGKSLFENGKTRWRSAKTILKLPKTSVRWQNQMWRHE